MVKLKLLTHADAATSTPTASTPPPPTPSGGLIKLKFNKGAQLEQTPSAASPPPSAAPTEAAHSTTAKRQYQRKPKDASAATAGKKRPANADISPAAKRAANGRKGASQRKLSLKPPAPLSEDERARHPPSAMPAPPGTRILLKHKKHPAPTKRLSLLANKGRQPPPRPKGVGYDSEDSDAEKDPAIEQQFVLRMQPGDDCDYLRSAIAEKKLGLRLDEGGADVTLRFLDKDLRRATVTVRGRVYAAALLDLPCVVETLKSWDRKGWWKVCDVGQLLLVLGRCGSDAEARAMPLPPRDVESKTMAYAHGLTPPMRWVRRNRFRKRVSYRTLEHVDEEVERLLRDDELAERDGGASEIVRHGTRAPPPQTPDAEGDFDFEGDVLRSTEHGPRGSDWGEEEEEEEEEEESVLQQSHDTLENDLAAAFANDDDEEEEERENSTMLDSPAPLTAPLSPAGQTSPAPSSSSPSPSPSPSSSSADAETLHRAQERAQLLAGVADLEEAVARARELARTTRNAMLRATYGVKLRDLEEGLRIKRAAAGLGGEDGEGGEED